MIGQYFPGKSLLHKNHPTHKIILLVIYCLLIFQLDSSLQLLSAFPLIFGTFWLCKIPLSLVLYGIKPLLILLVITFTIHGFTNSQDNHEILFQLGFLTASYQGLEKGLFFCLRLLLVVLGSSLLTLTTSSVQITYAVEKLLTPLKAFHFPVAEFSLMMSVSLRFIPVLLEELEKLIMAQTARGASFRKGNIKERLKSLSSLLIPLFNSALDRADQLAVAMEVRGFNPDAPRTSINEYKLGYADIVTSLTVVSYLTLIKVSVSG